jgi:hypothetical protein
MDDQLGAGQGSWRSRRKPRSSDVPVLKSRNENGRHRCRPSIVAAAISGQRPGCGV